MSTLIKRTGDGTFSKKDRRKLTQSESTPLVVSGCQNGTEHSLRNTQKRKSFLLTIVFVWV